MEIDGSDSLKHNDGANCDQNVSRSLLFTEGGLVAEVCILSVGGIQSGILDTDSVGVGNVPFRNSFSCDVLTTSPAARS